MLGEEGGDWSDMVKELILADYAAVDCNPETLNSSETRKSTTTMVERVVKVEMELGVLVNGVQEDGCL